ncbi:HAD-IIIA family hydrolase [Psittacicella gerlachiana]|nr:HAD-IIIA family hydrolase [Psittacicella gerlachiana]
MSQTIPLYQLISVTPHMLLAQKHKQLFNNFAEVNQPLYPQTHKVLFTDRDDTINDDGAGYLHKYQEMEIFPHAYQALKAKQDQGYLIVVVTNQSGISKNKFTEADFIQCMNDMAAHAYAQTGLIFDAVLYCKTSDPSEPWRKPNLETFNEFTHLFNVDKASSYMMGDKEFDIQYGQNLGICTIAVKTGKSVCTDADYVIDSIADLDNLEFK